MGRWFPDKSNELEIRNRSNLPEKDLNKIIAYEESQSRYLGGCDSVLNFLSESAAFWPKENPLTILDIHCGSGTLALSILTWARRSQLDVKIMAIDSNPNVIQLARSRNKHRKEINFENRDLQDPLFLQAQQFDYVISDGGLHAESELEPTSFLVTLNRLAKRGIIITDFLRNPMEILFMATLARFYGSAAVQQAEIVSRRSVTMKEIQEASEKAGLKNAKLSTYFGIRFTLSSERALILDSARAPQRGFAGA